MGTKLRQQNSNKQPKEDDTQTKTSIHKHINS